MTMTAFTGAQIEWTLAGFRQTVRALSITPAPPPEQPLAITSDAPEGGTDATLAPTDEQAAADNVSAL
jgi:hypothetical protein